jgi:hypothetical protein
MDTETMAKGFLVRKRAVHSTIYDLQGGPLPPAVKMEVQIAMEKIAQKYGTLAVDIKEE